MIVLDLDMHQTIAHIQQGKEHVRNRVIEQYLPFILKVTSRSCKRFVRYGEDDEVSIALLAFNEALDRYDCAQNTSFFSFAEAVIKRRIIDYFRKNKAIQHEVLWSSMSSSDEEKDPSYQLDKLTWGKAQDLYFEEEIRVLRRDEIIEFQNRLKDYGISFQDLILSSPKHEDARKTAFQIANVIIENEIFLHKLKKTKLLPLKDLEKVVQVSRKTLERQRKYIIALVVILTEDFYFLHDYIAGMKG